MACETRRRAGQSQAERAAEVKRALDRLQRALGSSQVSVVIGPQGAVAFKGWAPAERAAVTDACAYRTLAAQGSWELRQAVARAEAMQGRKVAPQAVAAGYHSHDQGRTWGKH